MDAYIATTLAEAPHDYSFMEVSKRLIKAGRIEEGLSWLERIKGSHLNSDVRKLRIKAAIASGDISRAIELLWESFSNLPTLRTLETIQELSDDDVRDQAIQLALEHDMPYASLAFFLDLKDWERAEELVFKQSHQLNGDYYYSLKPAAKFLECKAPLAASIIYSHRDYMQQLYNEHQRKRALWSLLADRDVFTVE